MAGAAPFLGHVRMPCPICLGSLVKDLKVLLLLAGVFGLGEAIVTSSAAALVSDFCREDNLGSAMGTFGAIFDVGHASEPILAGFMIGIAGSGVDYRIPFAIIALMFVAAAAAFGIGVKLS